MLAITERWVEKERWRWSGASRVQLHLLINEAEKVTCATFSSSHPRESTHSSYIPDRPTDSYCYSTFDKSAVSCILIRQDEKERCCLTGHLSAWVGTIHVIRINDAETLNMLDSWMAMLMFELERLSLRRTSEQMIGKSRSSIDVTQRENIDIEHIKQKERRLWEQVK